MNNSVVKVQIYCKNKIHFSKQHYLKKLHKDLHYKWEKDLRRREQGMI